MLKIRYFNRLIFLLLIIIFGVSLIIKPHICEKGIATAIILCGRVLIPSLFPFSVCMLYILKCGVLENLRFISPFTKKVFGLSATPFVIFIFSMLGGYPIGAKLIDESIQSGSLTPRQGRTMLNFCINAGPGFIISAVGSALLGNNILGYVLLSSHILASAIICIASPPVVIEEKKSIKKASVADNFVTSAGEASNAVISICVFVILFSVLISYIEYFAQELTFLRPLLYIMEVTNAVTKTNNIYIISFLLGFSGLCICCQILSIGKHIKINIFHFIIFRLVHGLISATITFITIKILPISLPTFSSTDNFTSRLFVSGKALGISIIILGIVFLISLSNKNKPIKILEELI